MNEQKYIALYNEQVETIKKNSATAFNTERDYFFAQFQDLGFPNKKTKNYRNTDFSQALSTEYSLNLHRVEMDVDPEKLFHCDVPNIQSNLYFVVNDMYYDYETEKNVLPEGVIVCGMKTASEQYPELVEKHLAQQSKRQKDAFVAFNGALAQDGFFMYVPKNVIAERPIQLVNMMCGKEDIMVNSHNLIIVEDGAQAQLVICDHAMDDANYFANRVTEVFVGENAIYNQYTIEISNKKMNNICTLLLDQKANSNTNCNTITLHNGLTRNHIQVDFQGENGEAKLSGTMLGDDKQLIDNTTTINHNMPNCVSYELFKYILDENSLGVFNGILRVLPDAQKTAAYQTNKNILLTNTAKVRTQPQLEIYADDVKCSHGSTTGQLDETALFYMRQRGIAEREARLMLMFAFVSDVIDYIHFDPLKDKVRYLVEKRLKGDMSFCSTCNICH